MTTPSEMLDALAHALAQPPGDKGTVLPVTVPVVLGVRAKYLGQRPDGSPVYGLTKRQCRRVRDVIHAAARADLGPVE